MAELHGHKSEFKSVLLLKDQTIGIGSYGRVCKAKCDALICAAKILHPTLFDPTVHVSYRDECRLPMRRFEQECHFLSSIRHPNIAQYLGMYQDPDTQLPVLLMELMDDSLTQFLDSSEQPIPFHIQVNICHDIILAVSFLHTNKIVHRDLSSNNVLMIGNVRAKVSDFGMAKLADQSMTKLTYTVAPGTDGYMPPEAVQDKPVYTEKLDCFSFGVIIIQVLTQLFPNPGGRRRTLHINHPGLNSENLIVEVRIPEVERRQSHIDLISSDNTLRQIGIDCLNDKADERPSALELCDRILVLKESSAYHDSLTEGSINRIYDKELRILRQQTDRLQREVFAKEQKNKQLRIVSERLAKDGEEKERQLELLHQQLQKMDEKLQLMSKSKTHGKEPQYKVSSGAEAQTRTDLRKLDWKEAGRAPRAMIASCGAAVDGSTMYVNPPEASYVLTPRHKVYAFDTTNFTWSQLPNCPSHDCPSVIIGDLLTVVGGNQGSSVTNKLISLTRESSDRAHGNWRWIEEFPPMPTKRFGQTALNTGTVLIVAGGMGEERTRLKTVEVMNIETQQWSSAVDLLEPLFHSFSAVIGDRVYLQGGWGKDKTFTQSVFTCSVTTLLLSRSSKSLGTRFVNSLSRSNKTTVWNRIADIPVTDSTCVSFGNKLLAVGGEDSDDKPTSVIHMYNSTTNLWEVIGHMPTPRYWCYVAALPSDRLVVVGGMTDKGVTDIVEIAVAETVLQFD